jgi:hypothetical protein
LLYAGFVTPTSRPRNAAVDNAAEPGPAAP